MKDEKDEYVYSDEDEIEQLNYSDNEKEDENDYVKEEQEHTDFYDLVHEIDDKNIIIDNKKPNFKCGSCKKSFLLEKNQKMIRCLYCGYRIIFKLRTTNYIT